MSVLLEQGRRWHRIIQTVKPRRIAIMWRVVFFRDRVKYRDNNNARGKSIQIYYVIKPKRRRSLPSMRLAWGEK